METRFDEARADRVQGFFEQGLVHTKGRFARRPFLLTDWQRDEIIRPLFGTVRFDEQIGEWVRAYTLAWIELARKNGKSEFVAGAGLYLLMADGEEEAEIYGAACDKFQAGFIFNVAKRMIELSPQLSRQVAIGNLEVIDSKQRIVYRPTGSFYQVVAADGAGNLGSNPHGVLFDEVITQPNAELWDAFTTGMGTRDQPLMLAATTAGNDPSAMAAEEHELSERVLADQSVDPSRFVFMRNTPMDADWRDETTWSFANPGLGDFLRLEYLRSQAQAAASSPRKQNTFRQLNLNQWVRQSTRWLDLHLWDENAGLVVPEQLVGKKAFGGLDMASTSDFAAWVLVFPDAIEETDGPKDAILARFWLPETAVDARADNMRENFRQWARAGHMTICPGGVIDVDAMKAQIDRDMQDFRVAMVGYDRWGANEITRWLQGQKGEQFAQGVAQQTTVLNEPSKDLERRLALCRLRHGGQPVLRWMADNVQAKTDSGGNIAPDRAKSKEKIDGIAALVDALWALLNPPAESFAFVLDMGGSN